MVNNTLLQNLESIIEQISSCNLPGLTDEMKAELKKRLDENGSTKNFEEIKKQLAQLKNGRT